MHQLSRRGRRGAQCINSNRRAGCAMQQLGPGPCPLEYLSLHHVVFVCIGIFLRTVSGAGGRVSKLVRADSSREGLSQNGFGQAPIQNGPRPYDHRSLNRPSARVSPGWDAGGGNVGGEHPSAPGGTGTTARKHPRFGPPRPSTPGTSL